MHVCSCCADSVAGGFVLHIKEINMKHHSTPANVQALSKALSTLLMDALFVTLLRVRFRDFQQVCATPKVTHVCKKNLQSATK